MEKKPVGPTPTTMLYKYPGAHEIHGDKFDFVIADDVDVEYAIKDGWSLTTPEAKAKYEEVSKKAQPKAGK